MRVRSCIMLLRNISDRKVCNSINFNINTNEANYLIFADLNMNLGFSSNLGIMKFFSYKLLYAGRRRSHKGDLSRSASKDESYWRSAVSDVARRGMTMKEGKSEPSSRRSSLCRDLITVSEIRVR